MFWNREKLVSIAEFADRSVAEQAWTLLEEVDIPAAVLTEPGTFGSAVHHRIEVERSNVPTAQALIAHLVNKKKDPA